ncbi:hypothetical protein BDM02DRAFT_3110939 [Thelephora ganbajun]|uniref:Uncharacterized protein n=1 Tax=Thelephora ganbajun TaxID=370292 RepID=A0ACB6ZQ10_THEGA|nr:hypothetical protein BDM02DRAFT_3110939 [Thelephora ganbajun]
MTESWEEIWEKSQSSLEAIRNSVSTLTSPTPRVLRVSQLDAESLDAELVQLLREPIAKALSVVNSSLKSRFDPELALIIQLTLYKLSVWDSGATYGAKLQDLRYRVPSTSGTVLTASGLPRDRLLLHGFLTVLVPYVHTRLRNNAMSNAWPEAPSSDRRRKLWDWMSSIESTHAALSLVSFVIFLCNGRYRTLTDRLLQMRLVPARKLVKRNVSYEFMNRQMVWHAFTEFIIFILPLINTRILRRRLARLAAQMKPISLTSLLPFQSKLLPIPLHNDDGPAPTETKGPYWSLSEDQCAICAEDASYNLNFADSSNALTALSSVAPNLTPEHDSDSNEPPRFPITIPYITTCGHVYCYYCIADRMLRVADEGDGEVPGWECLRCTRVVKDAERVEMEVEESSVAEFNSSEFDFSEMSGSVTSYSEPLTDEREGSQ